MVEQCGDELHLLLNELDKLCALAGEGEITREMIETAGTKNLEASVFDLSKAILQNHYAGPTPFSTGCSPSGRSR